MTIYSAVSSNKRKTFFFLLFFMIFALGVSYILARGLGYSLSFVGVFLFISGLMSYISYYYSDKIVLSMSGAKPATKETHRELFSIVENLSIASGNPMPKIYTIQDSGMNAFATGRDPKHAAVAATEGLLSALRKVELEGVIAHELSHVKNYDTRLMSVVAIIAGSLAILSDFFFRSLFWGGDNDRRGTHPIFLVIGIVAAILAPIAATIIQLAISRRREFLADADGALLTRHPDALADALEKIALNPTVKTASNATAHMYISNPFKKGQSGAFVSNLFSTHPPAAERIKILRDM